MDDKDKICPLLLAAVMNNKDPLPKKEYMRQKQVKCINEKCGFWNMTFNCCGCRWTQ